MPRFEQQGTIHEALRDTPVRQEECRREFAECPHCGYGNPVTILPFSPIISKVICRNPTGGCDRTFEVRTRQSAYDEIDLHVDVGKDKLRVGKRSSVNVKSDRVHRELAAISEAKAGIKPGAKVRTRFGEAYIIGKRQRV